MKFMQLISALLASFLLGLLVFAQVRYYGSSGFGRYEFIQCLINSLPLLFYVILLSIPVERKAFAGRVVVWSLLVCVFAFNLLGYVYAARAQAKTWIFVLIYVLSLGWYLGWVQYLLARSRSASKA
jgi:hypothetical protein